MNTSKYLVDGWFLFLVTNLLNVCCCDSRWRCRCHRHRRGLRCVVVCIVVIRWIFLCEIKSRCSGRSSIAKHQFTSRLLNSLASTHRTTPLFFFFLYIFFFISTYRLRWFDVVIFVVVAAATTTATVVVLAFVFVVTYRKIWHLVKSWRERGCEQEWKIMKNKIFPKTVLPDVDDVKCIGKINRNF